MQGLEQRRRDIEDWEAKKKWLLKLGLSPKTVRVFDLGRNMTELAWQCMVREAVREKRGKNKHKYKHE